MMKKAFLSLVAVAAILAPVDANAATVQTNPATKIISPFGVAQPGIQDPYDPLVAQPSVQDPYDPLTIFPPVE